jgi:hypothetical protein
MYHGISLYLSNISEVVWFWFFRYTKECIPESFHCDAEIDCDESEDELNCGKIISLFIWPQISEKCIALL